MKDYSRFVTSYLEWRFLSQKSKLCGKQRRSARSDLSGAIHQTYRVSYKNLHSQYLTGRHMKYHLNFPVQALNSFRVVG